MRYHRYNFNRKYDFEFNDDFDDEFDELDEYEDKDDDFFEDREGRFENYHSKINLLHKTKFPLFINEIFMK